MKKGSHTSILWDLSKKDLIKGLANCNGSLTRFLRSLGLSTGGCFNTLKERLKFESIDHKIYIKKCKRIKRVKNVKTDGFSLDLVMIENSNYFRGPLKKRIIKNNLIPYVCKICNLEPVWKDKKLVLILDHINGVRNDHRLENLRFLCPNCNSQTDTFAGRNKIVTHKDKNFCKYCNIEITKNYDQCRICANKNRSKVFIEKEELFKLIWEMPMTKVGSKLGLSDRAVGKMVEKHGLLKPPRGYWLAK